MELSQSPIGVFDSGVGGLTVAKALMDLMPNESIVYLGDTARYPFGTKPLEDVLDYADQIIDYLLEGYGVKLILAACNTASAALLSAEAKRLQKPVSVLGVIEPGVRSLASANFEQKLGVIATPSTISSGAYQSALAKECPEAEALFAACPGFVELVEKNVTESQEALDLAEELLAPLKAAQVGSVLLGCTHYPFLAGTIAKVLGPDVGLVSTAQESALEVQRTIKTQALESDSSTVSREWIATGPVKDFQVLGAKLFGDEMDGVKSHYWK